MEAKTTLKVDAELRDRIARLADEKGVTMVDLLKEMVGKAEREQFFANMEADLIRLRDEDPEEWESYKQEFREWDEGTWNDGVWGEHEDLEGWIDMEWK